MNRKTRKESLRTREACSTSLGCPIPQPDLRFAAPGKPLICCSHMATVQIMIQIVRYIGSDGSDNVGSWLERQTSEVRARVQTRLDRVELGNFGDHRAVGSGVFELRIHHGPGFRVYYGRDANALVILLAGSTKKRQLRDIDRAVENWNAYKREKRIADKGS